MSQYVQVPNRLFDCVVHIAPDTGKIQRKKHLPMQAVDIAVYIGLLSFQQRGKQLVVCKLATLAGRCHMSVSSLLRALGRMEAHGLIRRIHRYNRYGCRAACGYVLAAIPGGYSRLNVRYLRLSLSPREFCVLAWLNRCTGYGKKLAHPSVSKTAASCHMAENTVRRCIQRLESLGLLEKTFVFSRRGDHANNCIRFFSRLHHPVIAWMLRVLSSLRSVQVVSCGHLHGHRLYPAAIVFPKRGWCKFEEIPPKPT